MEEGAGIQNKNGSRKVKRMNYTFESENGGGLVFRTKIVLERKRDELYFSMNSDLLEKILVFEPI